jgi:hypothetical protein
MYIFKMIIKFIVVICLTLNLFGCGLYMMSKNEDILANTVIGTPKPSINDKIFTAYGSGNCNIFGRLGNDIFESCPIALSATDAPKNNILYKNDGFIAAGNIKNFTTNYFNSLDINSSAYASKNKAIILLTRDNVGFRGSLGTVDIYINSNKVSELIGHETAYIWDQDPGDVDLEIRQKERLLNKIAFKVEKGMKYHFVYNYLTGAVNPLGDENSKIYFTSYPPGASVYAGTDPSALKPTHILTPHTMTRPPGTHKWATEYYMLKLDGYKDSSILFKSNSFGDRIVHYNFLDPSSPEPPLSELPIRRNDPSKPLIQPAIPQ